MKNSKKSIRILLLSLIGLFSSCQTESVVEVHSTLETISKVTPLTTEIQRIAMQKTSQDNSIDKTNCFMIQFPYVLTVNNEQIAINSQNDYQFVQNNIAEEQDDNDVISFHFPITVILENYSTRKLDNQFAFNTLIAECETNSSDFGKINCLSIQFPIKIDIYNVNSQIATVTEITDNYSLFNFITNLSLNKFIAINYPITVFDGNGKNVIITNNIQLENAIKNAIDTCSEKPNTSLDFKQVITSNSWKITYFFNNDDQTTDYNGYTFTFSPSYTVVATKLGISYNGTWSTKINNGVQEFEIKFESDILHKIDESWKVFEFNSSQLRFRSEEENNETDYLYFEKI